MGSPSSVAAARFAASAARSPPSARAFSVAVATSRFQFGVDADAGDASALGLDALPLVQRGAIHGRVVRQLGGLHEPSPRLLFGDVAGVDRRAVRGLSPACRGGQHRKRVAAGPGRLVFLDEPGALHLRHQSAGREWVAVKMCVGQVCVGHGSIQPHVGDGIAGAFGTGAACAVARLGFPRARVVFPTMAGPLAGPVLAGGVVRAARAWSRLVIGCRVRARRPGRRRRRVLAPEIPRIKHGDRLAADARLPLGLLRLGRRRRRVADLRAARGRVLLGQRAVFLLGLLLPLPDGAHAGNRRFLCASAAAL